MSATKQQPKKVRGRPFQRKGADGWSDSARAAAADSARAEALPESTAPEEFASFARSLLTNPQVRRAFTRRWKRGEFGAAELKMISDASAKAPERTDRQQQVADELVRLKRLTRGERALLYVLTKRMSGEEVAPQVRGYAWRLVRVPGETAGVDFPRVTVTYEPAEEPDLDPTLPLAEASRRLALAPRRDEATEVDVDLIPTPEQALRALPGRERERFREEIPTVRDVHDADNEQHRAACRQCRVTWRERS